MTRKQIKGFTLVELLVVIGIIALLISILLPALRRAQESASRTLCMNNHKQLVAAVYMYMNDWKQRLPFCNWVAQEGTGAGQFNGPGWLYRAADWNAASDPKLRKGNFLMSAQSGSLYTFLKNDKVFRCPFDPEPFETGNDKVRPATSYGMNGALNGFGRLPVPFFQVRQFKPEAIMIWELDERHSGGTTIYNDGSNYPTEGITRRHGGRTAGDAAGALVSTFSGSVEWITIKQYNDEVNKRPGRLWCVPSAVSANGT